MKIAHIVQTSLDSGSGGLATYLRNIIPEQINSGHDVKAITNSRYEQFGDFSLPMYDFNITKNKKIESLLHSLNVNFKLSLSDFDILHYHFGTSAFFSFLPAVTGKKRVLTVHGRTEVARELKGSTKKVLRFVNQRAISGVDAVTTVSPFMKEFVRTSYGRENIYLPHGFKESSNLEANIIENEFGLTKDSYYLALGRLTHSKGFDTIIKAYFMMPETSKKLVIAGPANEKYFDYINNFIPEKMRDKIIFTGSVDGDKLTELYSNAFLYVVAIQTMGLSLTVLEAVSHKTPIVTSNVVGDNYGINNHTHRFENKNVKELSDLMTKLEKNSSERLKFVDSAHKYAVENHSWKYVSDSFIDIYNKILNKK